MTRAGRPRRTRFDFRVANLRVPIAFRVGRVTFRPPGWLKRRLRLDFTSDPQVRREWLEDPLQPLDAWEWSTASVFGAVAPGSFGGDIEGIREHVRDAIAVARLYQRACVPMAGMDHQTFGLASDLVVAPEWHWLTDRRGFRGHGGWANSTPASWEFGREWIRGFRSRPAFAFLDDTLRGDPPEPGSWHQRALSSVRTLNLASPARTPAMRIVLQAVALEALLADEPREEPQKGHGQAHPVSQRAAYLTCDRPDGARLKPGEKPCHDLIVDSPRKAEIDPVHGRRPKDYWDWPCTYYWHIRQLFDARNSALHDAQDHFPKNFAMRLEGRVDDVMLATLDWVVRTNSKGIGDLQEAIARIEESLEEARA